MSTVQISGRSVLLCLLATAVFAGRPAALNATTRPAERGRIVSTRVVASVADRTSFSDMATFNGRLFLTCLDIADDNSEEAYIRVMGSKDGSSWTMVEKIRQSEPGRELLSGEKAGRAVRYGTPQFSVVNGQRLSIQARDRRKGSTFADSDHRAVKWSSADGKLWTYDGRSNLGAFCGRPAWDRDAGYCYEFGTGCGSASTIQIWRTTDGQNYGKHFRHTFRDMPRDASLFFADGKAYCLLPRCGFSARYRLVDGVLEMVEQSPTGKSTFEPALLGSATFPYLDWEWKELGQTIFSPNVIHVPGMGTFAALEIKSTPNRTSLCRLDLKAGSLTELVRLGDLRQKQMGPSARLPEGEKHMPIGLAAHDGHIWVSYSEKNAIKVIKIALE